MKHGIPADPIRIEPDITGIVLAGGQSSRMGLNKALARFQNLTLIEWVIQALKTKFRKILIVTNSPDEFSFLQLPIVADEIPGAGPLGGLLSGLIHSDTSSNFITGCDLPFLTAELIDHLCGFRKSCDAVAFRTEKGIETLCAIYGKKLIPLIEENIRQKDYRVHRIFSFSNARLIPFTAELPFYHPDRFLNLNSPADMEKADRIFSQMNFLQG